MKGIIGHVGTIHALITFSEIIILLYFWHVIAYKYADSQWGQAMAFIV